MFWLFFSGPLSLPAPCRCSGGPPPVRGFAASSLALTQQHSCRGVSAMGSSHDIPYTDASGPPRKHVNMGAASEGVSQQLKFKVNRQAAERSEAPQPFTTVLNCRQPKKKRGQERKAVEEIKSERVPLFRVGESPPQGTKRKRSADNGPDGDSVSEPESKETFPLTKRRLFASSRPSPKPKLLGKGRIRVAETYICDDVWHVIIEHLDPAQLFNLYKESSFFHRKLANFKRLWTNNRVNHYGEDIPSPPEELTEYQYSDLLHGRSCQHCRLKENTRKAYWAFLRRWCTSCLHEQTVELKDALRRVRAVDGFPEYLLSTCLKSAQSDSWGNYLGVNTSDVDLTMSRPLSAVKIIFLKSELEELITAFLKSKRSKGSSSSAASESTNPSDDEPPYPPAMQTFVDAKVAHVERLRDFAMQMEDWERVRRGVRSIDNKSRRDARRVYFVDKALELKFTPPLTKSEIERSKAFRTSIAISKWPNNSAWQALRPKLEEEIMRSRALSPPRHPVHRDAKVIDFDSKRQKVASACTLPAPSRVPSTAARGLVLPLPQPTFQQLPPIHDPAPGVQRLRTMEPPVMYKAVMQSVAPCTHPPVYQQHTAQNSGPQCDTFQNQQYAATYPTAYDNTYRTPPHGPPSQTQQHWLVGQHGATLQNPAYGATASNAQHGAPSQSLQPGAGSPTSYLDRRLPPPIPLSSSLPPVTVPSLDSPGHGLAYQNTMTPALTLYHVYRGPF